MASAATFFNHIEPGTARQNTSSSKKYFFSNPIEPSVKKFDQKEENIKLIRWLKLMPAVAFLGVGATCLPHFALGCAIAAGVFAINFVMARMISAFVKPKMKQEYLDIIKNRLLLVTLADPILEGLVFQGAILKLSLLLIGLAFPPTLILPFLNTSLSIAATIAIFITAVLYAHMHVYNAEENNHAQVASSFLLSVTCGVLATQFGWLVSLGAHVSNNVIAIFNLSTRSDEEKQKAVSEDDMLPLNIR